MSTEPRESPESAHAQHDQAGGGNDPKVQQAEQGAEAYGGDPDAGPSVTEEEVKAGMERDQAEG